MGTDNGPRIRPNNRRPAEAVKRNLASRPRSSVSWEEVKNQLLRDCICAVTGAGAAIMLGRTSDGGALSITVLDGEQRVKEYPHDVEDAESTLAWLVSMYSSE